MDLYVLRYFMIYSLQPLHHLSERPTEECNGGKSLLGYPIKHLCPAVIPSLALELLHLRESTELSEECVRSLESWCVVRSGEDVPDHVHLSALIGDRDVLDSTSQKDRL